MKIPMHPTMEPPSRADGVGVAVIASAAPSPADILRACGWLSAGAGLSRLRNLSSSHSVHLATRSDGAEAVVKQRKPDGKRGLAPELFVYRMASWTQALGTVIAKPLHIDEGAQVLALEALPCAPRTVVPRRNPDFARLVGGALAVVHGATLDRAMPPSQAAGVLDIPDHPDAAGLDRPPQTKALMHRIAQDVTLADALRTAMRDYRIRCLIHGDLRPDHWVEMPDHTLRLIDWEMAGGGDPALDFAAAMIEPALDRVRSGSTDDQWLDASKAMILATTQGYKAANGPIALDDAEVRGHVVRLGAARLLHVACEWADMGGLDSAIDTALAQARHLLANAEKAASMIAA